MTRLTYVTSRNSLKDQLLKSKKRFIDATRYRLIKDVIPKSGIKTIIVNFIT